MDDQGRAGCENLDSSQFTQQAECDESATVYKEEDGDSPEVQNRANAFLRFIEEAWSLTSPSDGDQSNTVQMEPQEGFSIGRFQIRNKLGRGGFGVVHRAFDPTLQREIALKFPRPDIVVTEQLRRRFLKEGQASARLDHSNIVPVYEAAEVGSICYIASALCAGPSLSDWLSRHGAGGDPKESAALIEQLADAVQHAHERGVVHRDIKPGNILLEPVRSKPVKLSDYTPKVTDFGLAKIYSDQGDETKSGVMLGTPRYMSPEQAEGRVDAFGPSTDVFALGVILYELLTARPPFLGATELDTLRNVTFCDPIAPRQLNPAIPKDLEAICLKCLEKPTSRRYTTAAALRDDLRRFLQGQPTLARPMRLWERTAKWSRRRPDVAVLACTVCVFALCAMAGFFLHTIRINDALQSTLRSESDARSLLYASEMGRAEHALRTGDAHAAMDLLERYGVQTPNAELREFAWRLLHRRSRSEHKTLTGHAGDVYCMAWSPDQTVLATAGKDGKIRLWNAATFAPLHVLDPMQSEVNDVTFSPDGKVIASAGDDGTVCFLDSTGRERMRVHPAPGNKAYCVKFYADGSRFATCGDGTDVHLWMTATGEKVGTLKGHERAVEEIVISPDGKTLASASSDRRLIVWNLATRKRILNRRDSDGRLTAVAFSPDGRLLASAGLDRSIRFYDTRSGKLQSRLFRHLDSIQDLAFTSDGKQILSSDQGGAIRSWTIADRQTSPTSRPIKWCRFVGNKLLVVTEQGVLIRRGDRATDNASLLLRRPTALTATGAIALSLDQNRLAIESEIYDLDVRSLRCKRIAQLPVEAQAIHCVALSPDGRMIATASDDGRVALWDAASGELVAGLDDVRKRTVESLVFSPDGSLLATGDDLGGVELWDVKTHGKFASRLDHSGRVLTLCFSPNGRYLASAGEDKTIRMTETYSARIVHELRGHSRPIQDLRFSVNGSYLVSAGRDILFWDMPSGQLVRTLRPTGRPTRTISLSHQGNRLAAHGDGTDLDCWDLEDFETGVGTYMVGHQRQRAWSVAVSPDGKQVISGGTDGKLNIWPHGPPESHVQRCSGSFANSLAFSPDSSVVMTITGARLQIREAETCKLLGQIVDPDKQELSAHCCAARGPIIAVGTVEGSVRFWNWRLKDLVDTYSIGSESIERLQYSADGERLAITGSCGTAKILDVQTKTVQNSFYTGDPTLDGQLSFDRRWFVASSGNDAFAWDLTTGVKRTFRGHTVSVECVAISPLEPLLATASKDRRVIVWDLRSGARKCAITRHRSMVRSVAFSPDGKTLASGGEDGELLLTHVPTGQVMYSVGQSTRQISELKFSPDGQHLACLRDRSLEVYTAPK